MTLFVHEFPGPSFRFGQEQTVVDSAGVSVRVGSAFVALGSIMSPLVVELELGVFEAELGMLRRDATVPQHRRALAAAGTVDRVSVVIRAERVETRDALTPAVIEAWLTRQLGAAGVDGGVGVVELAVAASEALAPDFAEQRLRTRPGDVEVPIRRVGGDAWLAGPVRAASGQPPLRLVIRHDFNQLEAVVGVEWSWWSEGPGRRDLDRALTLFAEHGWTSL